MDTDSEVSTQEEENGASKCLSDDSDYNPTHKKKKRM
jgi:hypothetical protein